MYEKFFGLTERPFTINTDPSYLFLSSVHNDALVHLEYSLLHRASHTVVTGEIGTGKTTLLKKILVDLPPKTKYASIFNTTVDADEFLDLVLCEYSIPYEGITKAEKLNRLNKFFIDQYAAGNPVLLIVDEAQNLSLEVLEELRLLSNLQTEKDFLFQTILVGQPELKKKLNHPRLAQFAQRIAVHYHLEPMSRSETSQYVIHRLKKAGYAEAEMLFSEKALALIYKYSKGTPRVINLICDQALVYAYSKGLALITDTLIESLVADRKKNRLEKETAPSEKTQALPSAIVKIILDQDKKQHHLEKRLITLETAFMSISKVVNRCLLERRENGAVEENINLKKQLHELRQEISQLKGRFAAGESKGNVGSTRKDNQEKKHLTILPSKT